MSKKVNKKMFYLSALVVSVFLMGALFSFGLFTTASISTVALPGTTSVDTLHYYSNVCEDISRADGTNYTLPCHHNFFTDAGKNAVMDLVGAGFAGPAFSRIAIGNFSAAGNVYQFYLGSGLGNATGTFTKVADPGNWSISNTFTATANSMGVNGTALLNGSTTGSVIFANNTFTTVTLNNNDQITIRWNISIA